MKAEVAHTVKAYRGHRCRFPLTYILIYILCIQKLVKMTVGCGISHKNVGQIQLKKNIKISCKIKVSHRVFKCYAKSKHVSSR
jgi:hypothetical protein